MASINSFIFLVFYIVKASADLNLDSTFLNHLVDEVVKYPGSKNDKFLDIMWEKIVEFFPDSAITPPTEDDNYKKNPEDDYYECTTESEISLRLKGMIPGEAVIRTDLGNIYLEVYAELIMDKHPMKFKVVFKEAKKDARPPVSIDYKFTGKNTVKMRLEIPDFSNHKDITGKCLVIIHNIEIIKVGLPEIDWAKIKTQEEKDFVKSYWELSALFSNDLRETLTMAIVKALKKKIETDSDQLWICASHDFRSAPTTKHDVSDSSKYEKYCGGENMKN